MVMDSRAALSCPSQEGLPGSSTDLSPRAAPNHPEESGQVLALCFPAGVRLPPQGGLATLCLLTRPNRIRFTLRLTGSPVRGFASLDLSIQRSQGYMLKEQLHAGLLSFH